MRKTAFSTRFGTFQWRVLPLGLCNAPSSFQRMMDNAFKGVLGKCVWVYLDIIVFSPSLEQHLLDLQEVFRILQQHKLHLSKSKCAYFCKSLSFLGHVVSPDEISVEQDKVSAVKDWPRPNKKGELAAFLGLTNYYRRFVKDYARIATPLTDLLGGPEKRNSTERIGWTSAQHHSFRLLKAALVSTPVLRMPDSHLPFHIITDASDLAVGAILEQDDGNGPRPVAYASKRLSSAEANYSIRDKELLAVHYALRQFRVYVLGQPLTISTDHESLQYLLTQKDLSGRLARWAELFGEFDVKIQHIRGRDNPADVLSRPPTSTSAVPVDATFAVPTLDSVYSQDAYFAPIVSIVRNKEAPTSATMRQRAARFLWSDGALFLRDGHRRCIAGREQRLLVLQEAHDALAAGHQGFVRTHGRLVQHFFWPRMSQDVKKFVKTCTSCQRMKADTRPSHAPPQPLEVPARPWVHQSMDFMEMPVSTRGNNSLFVVTDLFSGALRLIPTTSTVDATGAARLYLANVFKLHGLPDAIVSDRDPRFVGDLWSNLWTSLGTKLRMTVAHRPQADGATERANRTIQEALRHYVNSLGTNWDDDLVLPAVEFALNSARKRNPQHSAFQLSYGFCPRSPLDLLTPADSQAPSQLADQLRSRIVEAQDALHDKKELQSRSAKIILGVHVTVVVNRTLSYQMTHAGDEGLLKLQRCKRVN